MSTADPLPRNFLRPCILLLLRESPAHGYDLLERAKAFGFTGSDPGGLYRALRALEAEGLVRSAWEPSPEGPDRRIYEITREGAEWVRAGPAADGGAARAVRQPLRGVRHAGRSIAAA